MKELTFEEFVPLAIRTESKHRPLNLAIIDLGLTDRVLHGFMGITTELTEFDTALTNRDSVNALEELGDMLWYLAILKDELDFPVVEHKPMLIYDAAGEGLDLIKKTMFYGKKLDVERIAFLSSVLYNEVVKAIFGLEGKPKVVMATIIEKLKLRYGDKFDDGRADNRELDKERGILEKGLQ